jgi:putative DNA primase/helicase
MTGDCPACGYRGGLTVSNKDGRELYYCHACRDAEAVFSAVRAARGDNWQPPAKPTTERDNSASEAARRIWRDASPATDSDVGRYLRARAIRQPLPPTLRYHAGLKHSATGLTLPAMVAAVTAWPFNSVVAIHRTFLRSGCDAKASVSKAKMTLGPCGGGAVRLAPGAAKMAIGEGIETSLSFAELSGLPTWAALSTGGLEALLLPDVAQDIIIAADHDTPGLEAANRTAERWTREGRTVRIVCPPTPGGDWNDYLKTETGKAAA